MNKVPAGFICLTDAKTGHTVGIWAKSIQYVKKADGGSNVYHSMNDCFICDNVIGNPEEILELIFKAQEEDKPQETHFGTMDVDIPPGANPLDVLNAAIAAKFPGPKIKDITKTSLPKDIADALQKSIGVDKPKSNFEMFMDEYFPNRSGPGPFLIDIRFIESFYSAASGGKEIDWDLIARVLGVKVRTISENAVFRDELKRLYEAIVVSK